MQCSKVCDCSVDCEAGQELDLIINRPSQNKLSTRRTENRLAPPGRDDKRASEFQYIGKYGSTKILYFHVCVLSSLANGEVNFCLKKTYYFSSN